MDDEKFKYLHEVEEENRFSKADFDKTLEHLSWDRERRNRNSEQQGFTFVKSKEGYWLNYALIKVFRRV